MRIGPWFCAALALAAAASAEPAPPEPPSWVKEGSGHVVADGRRFLRGVGIVQGVRDPSLSAAAANLRACDDLGKLVAALERVRDRTRAVEVSSAPAAAETPQKSDEMRSFTKAVLKTAAIAARWRDFSDGTDYSLCELELSSATETGRLVDELLKDEPEGEHAAKPVKSPDAAVWGGRVTAVALSPDGSRALAAGDLAIALWELGSRRALWTAAGAAQLLSFSADGTLAGAAGLDGLVRAWDAAGGRARQPASEIKLAMAVKDAMSRAGEKAEHVVSQTAKSEVKGALEAAGLSAECARKDFMASVTASDMSAVSEDQAISFQSRLTLKDPASRAWRERQVTGSSQYEGRKSELKESVSLSEELLSADGARAVSVSDETLELYDPRDKRVFHKLTVPGLRAAALSADGRALLAGGSGESENLKLWDFESGQPLQRWSLPAAISAVAFSADGRLALVGLASENDNLRLLRFGKDKPDYKAAAKLASVGSGKP